MSDIILPYHYREYEWENPIVEAFLKGLEIWMNQHRRSGKDLLCYCRFLLPSALKRPGTYQYIWPTLKEGRDGFWEGKDEDGRDILHYYTPPGSILKPDNQDMKLTLRAEGGTSIIQVFGTNNEQYNSLRGKPSNGAVLTEFAYQDPRGLQVISPMIVKTKGFLVFNSTPNGRNHFKEGYYLAKANPTKCFAITRNVKDTYNHLGQPLITEAQIDEERKKGKSEDFINQDYYCSFNQGIEGTYVGKEMQALENAGHITKVPYERELLVDTYWDLGVTSDAMAVWFVQQLGNEVRFIDFAEATASTFTYWAELFKEKGYLFGRHFAPPDVTVKEMVTRGAIAKTRLEHAADVGIKFEIVESCSFQNSIEVLRGLLPVCWFDEEKTRKGRQHLEMWGKIWNDIMQIYTGGERRDEHHHAGAAARYAAISIRQIGLYKSTSRGYADEDYDYVKKHSNKYSGL